MHPELPESQPEVAALVFREVVEWCIKQALVEERVEEDEEMQWAEAE
jgi:hypothetical protein